MEESETRVNWKMWDGVSEEKGRYPDVAPALTARGSRPVRDPLCASVSSSAKQQRVIFLAPVNFEH